MSGGTKQGFKRAFRSATNAKHGIFIINYSNDYDKRYIDNFKKWVEDDLLESKTEKNRKRTYQITPETGKDWVMVTSDTYVFDLLYKFLE